MAGYSLELNEKATVTVTELTKKSCICRSHNFGRKYLNPDLDISVAC
jgi:hypothetical protein